jgi:N-hydroxyarylamine O-acetyltransferase
MPDIMGGRPSVAQAPRPGRYNRIMPPAALDTAAYLRRIGVGAPAAPTPAALALLHEAHCTAVPFENLDILLGRPIRLDLDSLQRKLVDGRRGGYCFEQNSLFEAALEALGFRVTPLAARVRAGATGVRPRTHMLLRVDFESGPFLADVGFGGDGLLRPLPLAVGAELQVGPFAHRLTREGDGPFVLQSRTPAGWGDLYAFTLEPQHAVDYEVANHFTSTHPQSIFALSLTAQRSWPERRALLRNRELVVRGAAGERSTSVRDPEHLLELLATVFDLVFPAGTRFSKPDF